MEEEEESGQSQLSLSIWMTLDLSSYDFCGCETVYSTHMKPLISERYKLQWKHAAVDFIHRGGA